MAKNAKSILFFLLAICFSLQIHARDSKFFSKISKQNHESITMSPAMAPTLAPLASLKAEVIEHGYGLYGQDSNQGYEFPPNTKNPTKFGEDKYVSNEEFGNMNHYQESGKGKGKENGIEEKQGMSDTRFLENGKYYYDTNQDVKDERRGYFPKSGKKNGNGYEGERQGMSDTRFLENGKYFHDINEEKNSDFNTNNYEDNMKFEEENNGHFKTSNYDEDNEKFEEENNGHFKTNNYEDNEKFEEENNHHYFNTNNFENENEDFGHKKQGMSDTRFLENGKYYYDVNDEAPNKAKYDRFEVQNNENEGDRLGMSDTRFLENGKYYYDVNNEKSNNYNNKFGVEDVGFHNNHNVEYANSHHDGYGNRFEYRNKNEYGNRNEDGNKNEYGNRNEYENEEIGGGYKYNYPQNEYHGNKPKKYSNVYDTMEEYDREQGYIDGQDQYVP